MLTPQEVSNRAFTRAPFNGYNMTMVDEFLDELTEDYTALYKENATLKAKMKVMVEKVEEYRTTEESMRAALLTAQRMADSIIKEAEDKRDALLKKTEQEIQEKKAAAQREDDEVQERIRQGRQDLARFIAAVRELCSKEIAFLEKLPHMKVEGKEPERPAPAAAAPSPAPSSATSASASPSPFPPFTNRQSEPAPSRFSAENANVFAPFDDKPRPSPVAETQTPAPSYRAPEETRPSYRTAEEARPPFPSFEEKQPAFAAQRDAAAFAADTSGGLDTARTRFQLDDLKFGGANRGGMM